MTKKSILQNIFAGLIFVCLTAGAAFAQTTVFTYQGKLTDTGTPQAAYQMRFEIYDAPAGGNQTGATITNPSVAVMMGVFTVRLDFGAAVFDGADRYLDIAVRKTSGEIWTILTPRQQISSAPYSIKSMFSLTADALSTSCVGCVADTNIADVSGSKITGEIPTASVPAGSGNYIQNSAAAFKNGNLSPQQAAGFNIDGSGIIGDSLGIGIVPRSGIKLDIIGNVLINPGNGNAIQFGSPNGETGMSNIVGNGRADMRFDGTTLKLVAGFVGGPPPSTNGLVISNAGNVGIGTTFPSPLFKFSVVGSSAITGGLTVGSGTPVSSGLSVGGNLLISNHARIESGLTVFNGATLGGHVSVNSGNLSVLGSIFIGSTGLGGDESICRNSATGALAACASSLRYKTGVKPFEQGFDFLNQLRPINFIWKQNGQPDVGFGAEDVAKINPLFVTYNDQGEVEGVKYDRLSVVFVNALKEQQKQIEAQQRQIDALTRLVCLQNPKAEVCREN